MYEPFPGNYVWNLSVNICIGMGGAIGEIDRANERVREVAKQGEDAGTEAFFSAWVSMADQVAQLGDEAAAAGRFLNATEKYGRATAYYVTAERMQSRHYEPRKPSHRLARPLIPYATSTAVTAWSRRIPADTGLLPPSQ